MSIRAMNWVWENATDVGGNDLLVLLALSDMADDRGVCWPSIARLATKARISESTTHNIIRRLTASGWVTVERGGGRARPNRYTVQLIHPIAPKTVQELHRIAPKTVQELHRIAPKTVQELHRNDDGKGADSHQKGADSHQKGAIAVAPEPPREPPREPSVRERAATGEERPTPSPTRSRSPTPRPAAVLFSPEHPELTEAHFAEAEASQWPTARLAAMTTTWTRRRRADGRPRADWFADWAAFAEEYFRREERERAARAGPARAAPTAPVTFAEAKRKNLYDNFAEARRLITGECDEISGVRDGDAETGGGVRSGTQPGAAGGVLGTGDAPLTGVVVGGDHGRDRGG